MPSLTGSSLLLDRASNQHRKSTKLSENYECLAEKVIKSGYFSLFNPEIEWNIRYKNINLHRNTIICKEWKNGNLTG